MLPAVLFLIPGLAGRGANRIPLLESAKAFSVTFLPVVASSHLVKALFRITSRVPYYPLAFHDPVGYTTATLITTGGMAPDTGIAPGWRNSILYACMELADTQLIAAGTCRD
jgi:hypothetical protein